MHAKARLRFLVQRFDWNSLESLALSCHVSEEIVLCLATIEFIEEIIDEYRSDQGRQRNLTHKDCVLSEHCIVWQARVTQCNSPPLPSSRQRHPLFRNIALCGRLVSHNASPALHYVHLVRVHCAPTNLLGLKFCFVESIFHKLSRFARIGLLIFLECNFAKNIIFDNKDPRDNKTNCVFVSVRERARRRTFKTNACTVVLHLRAWNFLPVSLSCSACSSSLALPR